MNASRPSTARTAFWESVKGWSGLAACAGVIAFAVWFLSGTS
jgi:hypothetical protein